MDFEIDFILLALALWALVATSFKLRYHRMTHWHKILKGLLMRPTSKSKEIFGHNQPKS